MASVHTFEVEEKLVPFTIGSLKLYDTNPMEERPL